MAKANKSLSQLIPLAIAIVSFYLAYHILKYAFFYYRVNTTKSYIDPPFTPSPVSEEDRKTYTWLIHMYPPVHNAGAEWMAHAMNKYLVEETDSRVNVVLNTAPVKEFERVQIVDRHNKQLVRSTVQHSAVLLSHLDMEIMAVQTAIQTKRPLVLVMHNNYRKPYLQEFVRMLKGNLYLVHNSYWLKEYYSIFNLPSIVVYPPVDWREYKTDRTPEYVTLINLNRNKGGDVLIKIAKAMPDVQFLGVRGGYDGQIVDASIKNIKYVENTAYIKEIYSQTDILLVPSEEESWGRVAIEAMSSGIPVIAHPTPGLLESCGDAGIFCRRSDIGAWVSAIRRLKEDKVHYEAQSSKSFRRAQELDPLTQLAAFGQWMQGLRWKE
jgi:glycosyltransferase involved in cell wall biosynthesis